ncbi:hypothetical protein AB3464_03120 [Pseudomonas asplenii]|uniref:hypothetical protein n=1 Tax=Pseudomonas asplenii TaxID=53407 RepID=UPI0037C70537
MSDFLESDDVVAVVRYQGEIRWFRSELDFWVLDWKKWQESFVLAEVSVPPGEASAPERFNILVVNEHSADEFLAAMTVYEIGREYLHLQLLERYEEAASWWDVSDLFPVVFVDFDNKKLGAFYPGGTKFERFAPYGWDSEFVDFCMNYPEEIFPEREKFWVSGGVDMLQFQ